MIELILTSLVGKIDVVVVILDVLRFRSELCTTAASMVFSLLAKCGVAKLPNQLHPKLLAPPDLPPTEPTET